MKRDEIKKLMMKSALELEAELKESREKHHALKFDLDAGKVKNVAELRRLRKNIARILTALNTQAKQVK